MKIIWILQIFFGIISFIFAIIAFSVPEEQGGGVGNGASSLISGFILLGIGCYGWVGTRDKNPAKLRTAFMIYLTSTIVTILINLVFLNLFQVAFSLIDLYFIYVIHQYYGIVRLYKGQSPNQPNVNNQLQSNV